MLMLVQSLMFSIQFFFCLPHLRLPSTVPCRMALQSLLWCVTRGIAMGGGGEAWGACIPPQILGASQVPPPPLQKIRHIYFLIC